MNEVHPAVQIVEDEMNHYNVDKFKNRTLAHALVRRLIAAGFIDDAFDAITDRNKALVTPTPEACMKQFDEQRDGAIKAVTAEPG